MARRSAGDSPPGVPDQPIQRPRVRSCTPRRPVARPPALGASVTPSAPTCTVHRQPVRHDDEPIVAADPRVGESRRKGAQQQARADGLDGRPLGQRREGAHACTVWRATAGVTAGNVASSASVPSTRGRSTSNRYSSAICCTQRRRTGRATSYAASVSRRDRRPRAWSLAVHAARSGPARRGARTSSDDVSNSVRSGRRGAAPGCGAAGAAGSRGRRPRGRRGPGRWSAVEA